VSFSSNFINLKNLEDQIDYLKIYFLTFKKYIFLGICIYNFDTYVDRDDNVSHIPRLKLLCTFDLLKNNKHNTITSTILFDFKTIHETEQIKDQIIGPPNNF
jgi:hypothetical protein